MRVSGSCCATAGSCSPPASAQTSGPAGSTRAWLTHARRDRNAPHGRDHALPADHSPGTNHEAGRAFDIGAVDGEICRGARSGSCAQLVRSLAAMRGKLRSTELIYCWDRTEPQTRAGSRAHITATTPSGGWTYELFGRAAGWAGSARGTLAAIGAITRSRCAVQATASAWGSLSVVYVRLVPIKLATWREHPACVGMR